MREATARLVYPVFLQGLRLREQLDRGQRPDREHEQALLKGLLGADGDARWLAGDGEVVQALDRRLPVAAYRYALVCWLDELFSIDSPWRAEWTERMLEVQL